MFYFYELHVDGFIYALHFIIDREDVALKFML